MYIQSVTLNGFKRFSINSENDSFTYEFDKKITNILGTNGSGKSSLVNELIPNVTDIKKKFKPDGYKEVNYLFNNDKITIKYHASDNKHSFLVNGKELNDGNLGKMEIELIDKYFNINKDKHTLITGNISFSNMSISDRRRWLTEILSKIDYQLVLDLYKKSKSKLKELESYIKLLNSKIARYETVLKNYSNVEEMKSKLDKLKSIFNYLSKSRTNVDEVDINISEIEKYLNYYINEVSPIYVRESDRDRLINKINLFEKRRVDISNQIQEYDNIKSINVDDIKNKISSINKPYDVIDTIVDDVVNLNLDMVDELYELLDSVVTDKINIPDINKIETNLNSLKNRYQLLLIEKKEYEKGELVTCPKCKFSFNSKTEIDIDAVNRELDSITKSISGLKSEYDKITKLKNRLDRSNQIRLYIVDILRKNNLNQIANLISDMLSENKISDIKLFFNKIVAEMDLYKKEFHRREELANLNKELELAKSINEAKVKEMLSKRDELLKKYKEIVDEISSSRNMLATMSEELKKKEKLTKIRDYLLSMYNKIKEFNNYVNNSIKNNYIDSIITIVSDEISQITKYISEYESIQNEISICRSDIAKYKSDIDIYTKIVEGLSPNKGLIRDTVTENINIFLDMINQVLEKIWEYKIELSIADIDNMDYKFKVKLDKDEIPDISKVSSGMQEVIDLGFRIVAMDILELNSYPLILDEFGKSMDMRHRIKAYEFINEVAKMRDGQIFIISHYTEMFGRFNNADTLILDDRNIM